MAFELGNRTGQVDRMAKKSRPGWFGESKRHSLASLGVKTSPRSTSQRYPSWYTGTLERGSSPSDIYTQLDLKKDIQKGLVSPAYQLSDAKDDVIFVTSDMIMALSEVADNPDEDEDTRERYKICIEEANVIANLANEIFDRKNTMTEKDAKTWEKWINIAHRKTETEKGSRLDLTEAYADAMMKYFSRLARDTDDPMVKVNAERCYYASHQISKELGTW